MRHHTVVDIYSMHTKVITSTHNDVIETAINTRTQQAGALHIPVYTYKLVQQNETSIHCCLTTPGMYVTNTIYFNATRHVRAHIWVHHEVAWL